MATPNLDELATTTLRHRARKFADNVSNNNALLAILRQKGNVRTVPGGREIVEELDWDENSTYHRYSDAELLNIDPSEVLSAATYVPKQVAISVTITGREQMMNRGKEQSLSLLRGRLKNAERTGMNGVSRDVYSDGTADGGRQITGLQAQVSSTPNTGTVGGINAANFAFWRNLVNDTPFPALTFMNLKAVWEALYVEACRGMEKPDLAVADNETFTTYWSGLTELQRFTSRAMGKLGWENNLKFNAATVVLDGGHGGSAPEKTTYFLNTDYLHWRPYTGRDMQAMGGTRYAINQDASLRFIWLMANLTCSNRFMQAVARFT